MNSKRTSTVTKKLKFWGTLLAGIVEGKRLSTARLDLALGAVNDAAYELERAAWNLHSAADAMRSGKALAANARCARAASKRAYATAKRLLER